MTRVPEWALPTPPQPEQGFIAELRRRLCVPGSHGVPVVDVAKVLALFDAVADRVNYHPRFDHPDLPPVGQPFPAHVTEALHEFFRRNNEEQGRLDHAVVEALRALGGRIDPTPDAGKIAEIIRRMNERAAARGEP